MILMDFALSLPVFCHGYKGIHFCEGFNDFANSAQLALKKPANLLMCFVFVDAFAADC
jgi:hypothetical protein